MSCIYFKPEFSGNRIKLANWGYQPGGGCYCSRQSFRCGMQFLHTAALLAPAASQRSDLSFKRPAIGRKDHARQPGQSGFLGAGDFMLPQQKKACRLTWRKAVLHFLIQAVTLGQYFSL